MGSNEEDELIQMVTDYIESESTPPQITSRPVFDKPQSTLQEILFGATEFETQVLQKVLMYSRNMREPSSLKKWVAMQLQMDGYEVSLCKTRWVSSFSGPRVFHFADDYEYIDVTVDRNSEKPTRLIVDMDFKSQFELARPTQTYKGLTNSLPSVFVGTEERLEKIISLLCSAAKQSLKEKGLHVPPWRKAKYLQSKWLSKDYKKVFIFPSAEVGMDDQQSERASIKCCPSVF